VIKLSASSLFLDMLIDLFLNLNTCYSRWPSRTHVTNCQCLASFKSAYTLTNLPLANIFNAVHKCNYSLNSTSFHTSNYKLILFWRILPMGKLCWTCHSIIVVRKIIKTREIRIRKNSCYFYTPPFSVLPLLRLKQLNLPYFCVSLKYPKQSFWPGVMTEYGRCKGEFQRVGRQWTTTMRDNIDNKVHNVLHSTMDLWGNTEDLWGINRQACPVWTRKREFVSCNLSNISTLIQTTD
jgi:hypothetical protein